MQALAEDGDLVLLSVSFYAVLPASPLLFSARQFTDLHTHAAVDIY